MDTYLDEQQFIKLFEEKFSKKNLVEFDEIDKILSPNNMYIFMYYLFKYNGYSVDIQYKNFKQNEYTELCRRILGTGMILKESCFVTTISKEIVKESHVNKLIIKKNEKECGYIKQLSYCLSYSVAPRLHTYTNLKNMFTSEPFGKLKMDRGLIAYILNKNSLLENCFNYVVNNKNEFKEEQLKSLNKDIREIII